MQLPSLSYKFSLKLFLNTVSCSGLVNRFFFVFFLPCFLFNRFMTLILENSDINLKTLAGAPMHCTNGIMVQICTKREAVFINKQNQVITRKISFSSLPNPVVCYVSKKRVDVSHLAQSDIEKSIKSFLSNLHNINFI